MKRSTAVRHLREMGDAATQHVEVEARWEVPALRELWIGGDLLVDGRAEIEHVVTVLVVDVPEEELPEIARHEAEGAHGDYLGLGKRPMIWRSRPASRPPWSHLERRVARFWSADSGTDGTTCDGLTTPALTGVTVVGPDEAELRRWLDEQLPRSAAHLRDVLDHFWEGRWRREHTGGGFYPDDHLWRAAWAVQSMHDALAEQAS